MPLEIITKSGEVKSFDDPYDLEYAANLNENAVKRIITKNDNPNPFLILACVLTISAIIYYMYICRFKHNISGIWFTENGNIEIYHNIISNKIYLNGNYSGYITGDTVHLTTNNEHMMGIIYNNEILWINSRKWIRPIAAI